MALKVTIPCELVEEGEVEAIVSLDNPYSNALLVELPPEIDIEEHITLAEMGYDPPDCVKFKVRVEDGHGLRNIFANEVYFQAFLEAIEDQGAEALGDEDTWEVDAEGVAGAFAILLIDALTHGSGVKTDMAFETAIGIISSHWSEFFQTNAYQDKEMEMVKLAYEEGENDFIKLLDDETQSTLYEVDVQEMGGGDGPGHAWAKGVVTLTVGEEPVAEWDAHYIGYIDVQGVDWYTEEGEEHEAPPGNAEDFLDTMGDGTDFESEFRLSEPDVPCDEGEGRYAVFVDGSRVASFSEYTDADDLFEALKDSAEFQSSYETIELMELTEELDPEEDEDIDYDDPDNYYRLRS